MPLPGQVILPNEVLVRIPEEGTMCECGKEPVMADRFTIQYGEHNNTVCVFEPMFLGIKCWLRELSGEDRNHLYGVIPLRLTFTE